MTAQLQSRRGLPLAGMAAGLAYLTLVVIEYLFAFPDFTDIVMPIAALVVGGVVLAIIWKRWYRRLWLSVPLSLLLVLLGLFAFDPVVRVIPSAVFGLFAIWFAYSGLAPGRWKQAIKGALLGITIVMAAGLVLLLLVIIVLILALSAGGVSG